MRFDLHVLTSVEQISSDEVYYLMKGIEDAGNYIVALKGLTKEGEPKSEDDPNWETHMNLNEILCIYFNYYNSISC